MPEQAPIPKSGEYLAQGLYGSALEISWSFMYKVCVHRKTLRIHFSVLKCIRSEMTMKMLSAPCQHRE